MINNVLKYRRIREITIREREKEKNREREREKEEAAGLHILRKMFPTEKSLIRKNKQNSIFAIIFPRLCCDLLRMKLNYRAKIYLKCKNLKAPRKNE